MRSGLKIKFDGYRCIALKRGRIDERESVAACAGQQRQMHVIRMLPDKS
jgi:hypothetical protein